MHLLHSHKATQPHTHRWIPPYIFCGRHCCGDRDHADPPGTTSSPAGTGSRAQLCPSNPVAALTASATARQLWLKHNRKISPTIAGKPAPPNCLRQDPSSWGQPFELHPQQNTSSPSQGPALVAEGRKRGMFLQSIPPRAVVGQSWPMARVRLSSALGAMSPEWGWQHPALWERLAWTGQTCHTQKEHFHICCSPEWQNSAWQTCGK